MTPLKWDIGIVVVYQIYLIDSSEMKLIFFHLTK